ncbi:hypothetical protein AB0F96_04110 [Streptomyces sp. NPDC023998]|uniref:hypothetical protein n=1 Tax=Streptomyces sp. NPDC023998 TaxID=3154597 RepID=UPI0033C89C29
MSHQEQAGTIYVPAMGEIVKDAAGKVGEYMGTVYGTSQLRPVGGGVEWDVAQEDIRECSQEERVAAKLAVANARSSGEL